MIKTAAQILAEVRSSGTQYGQARTQYDAYMQRRDNRTRVGRPRQHKRCKATKFGTCYQPLVSPDYCRGHKHRLDYHGDLYAGPKARPKRENCKSCDKRTYVIYAMIKGVRKFVVDDHYTKSGALCRGSMYAPVWPRREWSKK